MKIVNKNLYIKKRVLPEWLMIFIFLFPFFMSFLIDFLGVPNIIKYSVDAAYIVAALAVYARRETALRRNIRLFTSFCIIFFLVVLIVYLFNYQSVFYFLWGVRNNFRFYIAFLLYATVFDEEEAQGCMKFIDLMFYVNVIISFFQFFVMGYRQDYLGGIFGVERGCNSFTIIFFAIVISKSLLNFMNGSEKAWICFLKCGLALLISAMAELKFFFVVFVLILFVSAIMTRFSIRKAILLMVAAMLLMFSGMLLPLIFGESRALTLENLWEMITASNYATTRDLGRFTAIPTISRYFLTNPLERLFGMGLGNCDTSSFAICNTPFFQSHSYLNYNWFSSAFLFLETGYAGLAAYLSFFVLCFVLARKQIKQNGANELFCRIGMIMSIVCFIMVFYNSSLRTETAYMAFFSLALPFVGINKSEGFDVKPINETTDIEESLE